MARFQITEFYGIAPRIPARSLVPGMAQAARNVDLSVAVKRLEVRGGIISELRECQTTLEQMLEARA